MPYLLYLFLRSLAAATMAVVHGNLASLLDASSPRIAATDRKPRPVAIDVVAYLPKREIYGFRANLCNKNLGLKGEVRAYRVVAWGKANSRPNAVDSSAEYSDDDGIGNGNGFEEERDWEGEMKKRWKENEVKLELETKAAELLAKAGVEDVKETEEQKMMRIRKELQKAAQEQAERRKTAELMYELGQKAYGKGMYRRSIEYLEGSLTIIPRATLLGGEVQIWLGMAYEANDRHDECIDLYMQLEKGHPNRSIRRQAADLLFIYQAPKIKITEEERVAFPSISNTRLSTYDGYGKVWFDKDKYKYQDWYEKSTGTAKQLPPSGDFLDIFDYFVLPSPAELAKNRSFWVALTLWLGLVAAAFLQQR